MRVDDDMSEVRGNPVRGPVSELFSCDNERDGEFDQHRNSAGKRWYYGDHMQRGMPKRYIYDNTPLIQLVYEEIDRKGLTAPI
jgi:hypothetical protein